MSDGFFGLEHRSSVVSVWSRDSPRQLFLESAGGVNWPKKRNNDSAAACTAVRPCRAAGGGVASSVGQAVLSAFTSAVERPSWSFGARPPRSAKRNSTLSHLVGFSPRRRNCGCCNLGRVGRGRLGFPRERRRHFVDGGLVVQSGAARPLDPGVRVRGPCRRASPFRFRTVRCRDVAYHGDRRRSEWRPRPDDRRAASPVDG
jgi:hypothetical protein